MKDAINALGHLLVAASHEEADRIVGMLADTQILAKETVEITATTTASLRRLTVALVIISAATLILAFLFALAFWRYAIVVHL